MKKITGLLIMMMCIVLIMAFKQQGGEGNATAQKITGMHVYVYSEPTEPYEILDNGKVLMTLTGGCSEVVNQAVKKATKIDGAQGVIVYLESSKWSAIKYKK